MSIKSSSSSFTTNVGEPSSITTALEAIAALDSALLALRPPKLAHHHISTLANKLNHHIRSPGRPEEPNPTVVWLFDSTAYHAPPSASSPWRLQPWETQIKAAYFGGEGHGGRTARGSSTEVLGRSGEDYQEEGEEALRGRKLRKLAVRAVVNAAGVEMAEIAEGLVETRLAPWCMKILSGQSMNVQLEIKRDNGRPLEKTVKAQPMCLEPGDTTGTSTTILRVPEDEYHDGEELDVYATTRYESSISARTRICSGKGLGVISTFEGTLWQFDSSNAQSVIHKVFCEVPKPVEGMPELLVHIVAKLANPPVWYLTTAPYCLYPMLRQFRGEHFPSGTIVHRESDWRTASGLLWSIMEDTKQYKLDQLQQTCKRFPRRSMILIGSDAEVRV